MLPDFDACIAARQVRDSSLDGVVFVGAQAADAVAGTFCVPSCVARVPARKHMRFFASAAAALADGFEPCRRCQPQQAVRIADWRIESPLVLRGLRLVERGELRRGGVPALAQRLGVSIAELNSAFAAELGASPAELNRAWSAQINAAFAQGLAPFSAGASAGSVAGKPTGQRRTADRSRLELQMAVRQPYDADWVFDFLDKRSLPGLEEVVDGVYRRRVGKNSWLTVSYENAALHVSIPSVAQSRRFELLGRIRHVFDVCADSAVIDAALASERWIGGCVTGGIRVPGAWDGFETAVRAILGQQVSVARARNLAIALMQQFGDGEFPEPAALVDADVSAIGMPGKRGGAVRELAAAVLDGRLHLDNAADPAAQFAALCALPGIGPWTAGYIAMRVAGDANAFPRGDWVILKQLGKTAGAAEKFSHAWQPFRAYALMYIWQSSNSPQKSDDKSGPKTAPKTNRSS